MRLSSIKLAGFKSFVDPSSLQLPSNLTAVVGPNGCGKSNIIDAVRWVLGESSMKQLRSDTMEDVIFNGSKSRKPAGRASIELAFDNHDGTVQGPYSSYAEITVRRELQRDGNSQYFLNGAKCLKRDVTDLFLGTGLGARTGYAIIEQGMVSNMIQARPDELRVWLEEAAGISKYKERRRETETRIKQTRENLARLADLRGELQARMEALEKQAKNAEKYKEFKEQERNLKAELLALRSRALARMGGTQEEMLAQFKIGFDQSRVGLQKAHEDQTAAETANREANHALAEQQNKVYEAEADVARKEQNLEHARELKTLKQREIEQIATQLEELAARESTDQARLTELSESLQALDAEAQSAQATETAALEKLQQAEATAQATHARWEDFNVRAQAPLAQAEGERVRVQSLEAGCAQTTGRLQQLSEEQAGLDEQPLQRALFNVDSELETLTRELGEGQTRLQALDDEIQQLRDKRAHEEGGLHEARDSLQSARGRVSSLETLQQAALRQDDDELKSWLAEQGLDNPPRLASSLRVDRGWENAVEHVLQGVLQSPMLLDFDTRAASLTAPTKTGVVLVDGREGHASAAADRLAAKVQGPAVVAEMLQHVHIASTAEEAASRASRLGPGESVIESNGIWRGRGWVRYPYVEEDRSGVLARGALLDELRNEVQTHSAAVTRHEEAVAELRQQVMAKEAEKRQLAEHFDTGRGKQAQQMAFRQAQAVRLEQAQTRASQLTSDGEQLRAIHAQQESELQASKQKLAALEETEQKLRGEREQIQQELAQHREAVGAVRSELSRIQQQRGEAQVKLASANSAVEALRRAIEERAARSVALKSQDEASKAELTAMDEPIAAQEAGLDPAREEATKQRELLRQAREAVTTAEERVSEMLRLSREAEFAQDAAREKVQQAQIEFQGVTARKQALAEQIAESGFSIEDLLPKLQDDSTPEAWEEKLATMGRRIDRLGAINLAAIQELGEAKERHDYFNGQNEDLSGALDTLESAIKKIDVETRDRFKTTFEGVNALFKERFPKLFGGGEAYLELTDDNLLETGVRVMARPPGKRNSSIQLLSGGEKAMTAVALLLSLFELNPAPFCLLDEVDAPLDDANVGRFVEVIREMGDTVQFVIITHNKITMELAAQLHGVTMQEPGVSRLVSVDIQQAIDLAAQRESSEAVA